MRKLSLLLAAAAAIAAFGSTGSAMAATCGSGTSQARDANGNPTGADTLFTLPDGGVVYGSSSYVGVTGPQGYIDVNTSPRVTGAATAAPVSGTLNSSGLKLQGVNCG